MCGIAGYSVGSGSRMSRTFAAQALLAGIAERGADAVGYAHRASGRLEVHKQQTGASALLETVVVPPPRRRCSFTCGTTRRATPRSPRTTIRSVTAT